MLPKKPNVLVTGTPGTGKTSLSELVAHELGFRHIEVGKVVKEEGFYSAYDPQFDTHVIEEGDEDRLLDFLEARMVEGGNVVDYHSCELFPERWFKLVVVLRASTEVLHDRLTQRGYSDTKRDENMEAEITGVVEEEARDSYAANVVLVRENNTLDDMMETVGRIGELVGNL
jgi:adenylate kinase